MLSAKAESEGNEKKIEEKMNFLAVFFSFPSNELKMDIRF